MHLTRDDLHAFFADRLGAAERRRVVRHLLSRCAACRQLANEVSQAGKAPLDYGAVFTNLSPTARMLPGRLQAERMRAREQWSYLQRLVPAQRLLRVENDPRFHTFGLYEILLEAAKALRYDPLARSGLAYLASSVAERLDDGLYGKGIVLESRAAALATLGNAQRLVSEHSTAADSLAQAERIVRENTDEPLEIAYLESLKASLQIDVGDFGQAVETIARARSIYQRLGDRHLIGRADVQAALAVGCLDPTRGIEQLARARTLISGEKEPHLLLSIWHTTATFLCDLRQPEDALDLLHRSRSLYRRFDSISMQVKRRWLEGRISLALGRVDEAEAILFRGAEVALRHGLRQEHDLMKAELIGL